MTSRMYIILLSFISASTIRNVDGESWAKFSGRGGGGGMLYPRESESRQIQLLDGMWNFRADTSDCRCEGLFQKWYLKPLSQTGPLMPMPVPSSFNDVTVDAELQNFVGWVWYDRLFYVASEWRSKRIVLRIDSAHYNSIVVCATLAVCLSLFSLLVLTFVLLMYFYIRIMLMGGGKIPPRVISSSRTPTGKISRATPMFLRSICSMMLSTKSCPDSCTLPLLPYLFPV